jgi:hypothetical protein
MFANEYVAEKLRELEEERLARAEAQRQTLVVPSHRRRTGKPVIGPLIRVAGRTLRRAGEGLEGWAAPAEPEQRLRAGRRAG